MTKQIAKDIENPHESEVRSNNSESEIKVNDSDEISTSDFKLLVDEKLFTCRFR